MNVQDAMAFSKCFVHKEMSQNLNEIEFDAHFKQCVRHFYRLLQTDPEKREEFGK
jgi:hypothetical protein